MRSCKNVLEPRPMKRLPLIVFTVLTLAGPVFSYPRAGQSACSEALSFKDTLALLRGQIAANRNFPQFNFGVVAQLVATYLTEEVSAKAFLMEPDPKHIQAARAAMRTSHTREVPYPIEPRAGRLEELLRNFNGTALITLAKLARNLTLGTQPRWMWYEDRQIHGPESDWYLNDMAEQLDQLFLSEDTAIADRLKTLGVELVAILKDPQVLQLSAAYKVVAANPANRRGADGEWPEASYKAMRLVKDTMLRLVDERIPAVFPKSEFAFVESSIKVSLLSGGD